ncbi:coproporphyrinogen dehydrogenase HemZ [Vallitalea pronyensis]|uniref:Coproporphyrinogen dehydrogenase HemZ n=1 Tax=Vallitalea pronyensis TaxID=1348613 RepID=A0A8J8SHS0_9FIRM|nr:coproporphyrinogen dehydrogenase HemZ [Vallitalea pronyensis]QUI23698.1 coproporphyrinogen dehydrogenase HemZ [Vallitalea pronyensis]
MKLVLIGHDFAYEMKMLLNLFFPGEDYKIVDHIDAYGVTVEAVLTDECCKVTYYKDGESIATSAMDKEALQHLPDHPIRRKKACKMLMKKLLYKVASHVTGQEQPWGILTGIRPTKIVFELIQQYGLDRALIMQHLRDDYHISEKKIELMLEIAEHEWPILEANQKDEINVYIGIPFCPTRCLYCSFTSYPIDKWAHRVKDYLRALEKEMAYVSSKLLRDKQVKTIYVGGGTPTALDAKALEQLMTMIHQYFDVPATLEFTVEAGRPDTMSTSKLAVLKTYGVTRISINPQTMHDKTLKVIGRHHTVEDIRTAFSMAREAGFDNINMDLILGLPGEDSHDVIHTMKQVKALNPDSLTVHTMAVKRASKLKETLNQYELIQGDMVEDMITIAHDEAKDMGLFPYYMYRQKNMVGNYENVGYSNEGKMCVYNVEIMEEAQTILALGAGAISKVVFPSEKRIERIENVKNVEHYIERIDDMIERKRKFFNT